MRAFKVFMFGLLYGWFVKIAFDRIYRDNEMEDIRNENRSFREYIRSLERQLEAKAVQRMALQPEPRATPAPAPAEPTSETLEKDNLKIIQGIGPAIERKLNNAGIYSFAALARLSRADLENILGNQIKRLQDENNLIAQAKKLAKRK